MERGDVPSDTSPLYFCLEKFSSPFRLFLELPKMSRCKTLSGFAEGTCIQENSNKVWFSLHLIVPLASLNGNKGYNKAVCCYATDDSTAA